MKKVKLFVTQKGAELKCNNWTEGQEIMCNEAIANLFIEKGFAMKEKAAKQPKEKSAK